MQIKIGFVHNARELVVDSAEAQDAVVAKLEAFLQSAEDRATLVLESVKGNKVIVARQYVAYAEVAAETRGTVGFL